MPLSPLDFLDLVRTQNEIEPRFGSAPIAFLSTALTKKDVPTGGTIRPCQLRDSSVLDFLQ